VLFLSENAPKPFLAEAPPWTMLGSLQHSARLPRQQHQMNEQCAMYNEQKQFVQLCCGITSIQNTEAIRKMNECEMP